MSHPENTLKEIIDRQNKKIDEMIKLLISYSIEMNNYRGDIGTLQTQSFIKALEEVRKL